MATIKKYNGSTWENAVVRKYGTASEIITPPTTIYADGTAISTYTIKGNTVQSGTPTPSNPVAVSGVGNKTANLLQNEQTQTVVENNGITFTRNSDGSITANGTATARAKYQYYGLGAWKYAYDTDYFLSGCPTGGSTSTYSLLIDSTATQFRDTGSGRLVNVASGTTGTYNFEIRIENGVRVDNLVFKPMLNTGSTPLPYEPYGYKIPILNGQQSIDIYIGDLPLLKSLDGTAVDEISNGTLTRRVDSDGSVLPAPITTQITMPSIPTTDGANSITVDTTVQPSEFAATWTGWHDSSVQEYDGTNWQ